VKIKSQSMTTIKNKIFGSMITNENLIKSLVMLDYDFLNVTPTIEEQALLDNPYLLIRKQIFPYQKVDIPKEDGKVFVTTKFYNFKKKSYVYQQGMITFYALVPVGSEPTEMGSRYDFIIDLIDDIFSESGLGVFEFYDRSDITVNDEYIGAEITFKITDFKFESADVI